MRPRVPVLFAGFALALDLVLSAHLAHADALDDAIASRCALEPRLADTAGALLHDHDPIDRESLRANAESHGIAAPSVRAWVGRGTPDAVREAALAWLTSQNTQPGWSHCASARDGTLVAVVMVPRLARLDGPLTPADLDEHRHFRVTLPEGARTPVCMVQRPDGAVDHCDPADVSFPTRGDYAFQILADTAQGPLPFATWHVHAGAPDPAPTDDEDPATPDAQPTNTFQLLSAINRVRARTGHEPLRSDPMLSELAHQRAVMLAARGAVAHAIVRDDTPVTRLRAAGVSADRVAENVARAHSIGEASARLDASPSHRANRIDPALDAVGIGVATVGSDVYLVELYAARPRIAAGITGGTTEDAP